MKNIKEKFMVARNIASEIKKNIKDESTRKELQKIKNNLKESKDSLKNVTKSIKREVGNSNKKLKLAKEKFVDEIVFEGKEIIESSENIVKKIEKTIKVEDNIKPTKRKTTKSSNATNKKKKKSKTVDSEKKSSRKTK